MKSTVLEVGGSASGKSTFANAAKRILKLAGINCFLPQL